MDGGFQLFDIIVLGMIAAFILLRLRSVLGKRTGHEAPPPTFDPRGRQEETDDNVIQLPGSDDAPAYRANVADDVLISGPAEEGLMAIRQADRNFDAANFIEGARWAYEMIGGAFAAGDRDALRDLLSPEVFRGFDAAITAREQAGQSLERSLVSLDSVDIVDAQMNGRMAEVTVKFVSEQIDVLRESGGEMLDGESDLPQEVIDIWTFTRNTKSSDPNWMLVATREPDA